MADFTADVVSGCSPLKVRFTDKSSGNPTAWEWNLGNGTVSTLKNPSGVYFAPGIYTVSLTITTAAGKKMKTALITVFENPKPSFIADPAMGCAPLQVQFADQSAAAPGTTNTQWLWDFGNGTQSTERNPSVKYNNPGVYTVVLKVTNDKGCTGIHTEEKLVTVGAGLGLNFTTTAASVCQAPFSIQFQNSAPIAGVQYQWQFGDGSKSNDLNPLHVFEKPGIYPVQLIANNNAGCTDTLTRQLDLSAVNTDFKVSDTLCANSDVRLTNTSSPVPLQTIWTFPDGTTATTKDAMTIFKTPGTYRIVLTNTYAGCTQSVEKSITVLPSPVASFQPAFMGKCSPDLDLNFENRSQNAVRYEWNFGDNSPVLSTSDLNVTHFYNANGSFNVSLTAFNSAGCSHTFQLDKPIRIGPPSVRITNPPEPGCVPLGVNPQIEVSSINNIAAYQWNFGDGGTSNEPAPAYLYQTPGVYNMSVTITTVDGCSATYAVPVQAGAHSVPAFTAAPNDVCATDSIRFTNLSQPSDAKFLWFFGDGGTDSRPEPGYAYNDTGWFQVKLLMDNNGCKDSVYSVKNFIHIRPPVARFTMKADCAAPFRYVFTDHSIFDPEAIDQGKRSWKWTFPNGSVFTGRTPPAYDFPGPGEYTVELWVSNGKCEHTTRRKIRIMERTVDVDFNNNKNCYPVQIAFRAKTPVAQNVVQYRWQVGSFDTTTKQPSLDRWFPEADSLRISLTTTDDAGCVTSVTRPVLISGPRAGFARTHIGECKQLRATFSDSSRSFGSSNIVSWRWEMGDGTVVEKNTGGRFDHTYDTGGTYAVRLTVTDAAGCSDTMVLADSVTIPVIDAAGFITSQACYGFPVQFENRSTGNYKKLTWDFGDGNITADLSGTHLYKDTGSYNIRLMIEDELGCRDSVVLDKYVRIAQPVASFSVNDSISFCPPFDVLFRNTSDFYGPVEWRLGNEVSNDASHRKLFTQPGKFEMVLTVKSPDGNCSDSASKTITLYRKEDARIEYDPLQACMPGIVNFSAFDDLASATFYWDFGDGNILDTSANKITHVYEGMGSYTPKIILTESSGCVITLSGKEPIEIKGVQTNFRIDEKFFCDSGYVTIFDSTRANEELYYHWDFGDGTTSNLMVSGHQYTKPGTYSMTLAATTLSGCTDTARLTAAVTVASSPSIGILGDSAICIHGRLQHAGVLHRQDTSLVRWFWTFPNGANTAGILPPIQQYNKAGNFAVTAIAVNSSGCADTAVRNMVVHPLPEISMPEEITTPVGAPVSIPAKYSKGIVRYHWMPAGSLSCSDCPQPIAVPKFNSRYSVHVVDSNGCKNREEIMVTVLCEGVTVFIPNTFSPNGDGRNDQFFVRGQGIGQIKIMQIYNRWGEIVFEQTNVPSNSAPHGWNGRYKGRVPQEGVYVYQLQVYCGNGQVMHFRGNVALIQ